ncbi:MAG: TIGR04290 family methyltransferase [Deltaproteobacteria bacterium]|nr:TIGR04290 family methyltransferase [Deltaproteobacteria bacterium]
MQRQAARLQASIARLGPWFHNIHLPGGIETAPGHFLGDFPSYKWRRIENLLPADLRGWSVLDIGCNAGFYSFELAKRGAKVLGVDSDRRYLAQAEFISKQLELENKPSFSCLQVHELATLPDTFDLVLFMGVFYHLRYPMLALDTVAAKTRRLMVFQSLTMRGAKVLRPKKDYPFGRRAVFSKGGWPKLAFIEHKFASDATNWWVPNHAAAMAMLRSTGFERVERRSHEIYFCYPPKGGVAALRTWDEGEWLAATGQHKTKGRKE